MIQRVKDPWPENKADCAVFSIEIEKSERIYFVRLDEYTFKMSHHDLVELRNRINGVVGLDDIQ